MSSIIRLSVVKQWLAQQASWLLIFDSADDLVLVYDFLPASGKGHVILTTRDQAVGSLAEKVGVEKLNKEDSTIFLLKRTRLLSLSSPITDASLEDRGAAEAIAKLIDGLPLALDQAGAYIVEMGCSLSHYYEIYQVRRFELLKRRSRLPSDHPEPVAITWSISFQQMERTNPVSTALLRFCSFLEPEFIPEELVAEGLLALGVAFQCMSDEGFMQKIFTANELVDLSALLPPGPVEDEEAIAKYVCEFGFEIQITATDSMKLDEALSEILRFSLIERNASKRSLSMHRLVQEAVLDELSLKTKHLWALKIIESVNHNLPEKARPETWHPFQRYLPQAEVCIALIHLFQFTTLEAARLPFIIGYYLQEQRYFEEARSLYELALSIYKQALGMKHISIALTLHELARLSFAEGKFNEAEQLFKHVLFLYEQLQEPDDSKLTIAMSTTQYELARLLIIQERYLEAESLLQYVLSVREQVLGPEHIDTVDTLHELAAIILWQGRYEEAEPIFQYVLLIEEKVLGPDHLDIAATLDNLAALYVFQGNPEKAHPLFDRILDIYEKTFGKEHTRYIERIKMNASFCDAHSLYDEATRFYELFLNVMDYTKGESDVEDYEVMLIMKRVSALYYNQQRFEDAKRLLENLMRLEEKTFGSGHPKIVITMQNLAVLYQDDGQHDEAKRLYDHILSIWEKVGGTEKLNLDFATAFYNLAAFYVDKEQYEQARSFYSRTINIRIKVLGLEDPDTQAAINGYAFVEKAIKRKRYAETAQHMVRRNKGDH